MTCRGDLPWWRRIRPEEYLFVLFASALAATIQFGGRVGWSDVGALALSKVRAYAAFMAVPLSAAGVLAVAVVAWRRRTAAALSTLRDVAPFLLAYLSYVLLRDLVPLLRPGLLDGRLADMETAALGVPSFVAIPNAIGCAFLDFLLMGCYLSHYYVPPAFAIWLAWKDRARFRTFMLALTISWAVGYLGYLAVPAIGPKYYFANYELWKTHPGLSPALHIIEGFAGISRDCFPSMHVAWTVLTLWFARPERLFFRLYLPVGAGLALATLYFGFHYLIDLPAGALLAVLAAVAARRLHDWWNRGDSAILRACGSAPSGSGSPPASACS
ncbi:MAG: phosphatase PAP2 family protein [Planctomycetes bacterium]|nr:phosphatase PAP2 family protein [Planctomycetota bacterium]